MRTVVFVPVVVVMVIVAAFPLHDATDFKYCNHLMNINLNHEDVGSWQCIPSIAKLVEHFSTSRYYHKPTNPFDCCFEHPLWQQDVNAAQNNTACDQALTDFKDSWNVTVHANVEAGRILAEFSASANTACGKDELVPEEVQHVRGLDGETHQALEHRNWLVERCMWAVKGIGRGCDGLDDEKPRQNVMRNGVGEGGHFEEL